MFNGDQGAPWHQQKPITNIQAKHPFNYFLHHKTLCDVSEWVVVVVVVVGEMCSKSRNTQIWLT